MKYQIWHGNEMVEDLRIECADEALSRQVAAEVIALTIRDVRARSESAHRVLTVRILTVDDDGGPL